MTEHQIVKPLVWDEFKTKLSRHFQSNTVLGQYQIGYLGEFEQWQLFSPQKSSVWKDCFSRHSSSEEAKTAAQADYEQRILSALSVSLPSLQEIEDLRDTLSALSSYLGCGLGDDKTTAQDFYDRILFGITEQHNGTVRWCASVVERLSQAPSTTWGEVKAEILKLALDGANTRPSQQEIAEKDARIERLKEALRDIADITSNRCFHDGGFDREIWPIGCCLGDKCVCIGVHPIARSALQDGGSNV